MKQQEDSKNPNTTVRMLGPLVTFRKSRGLPTSVEMFVPEEGLLALDIARELGLPMEKVGHVFCNNTAYGLEHLVRLGDRVALVSPWVVGTKKQPLERPFLGGEKKT